LIAEICDYAVDYHKNGGIIKHIKKQDGQN